MGVRHIHIHRAGARARDAQQEEKQYNHGNLPEYTVAQVQAKQESGEWVIESDTLSGRIIQVFPKNGRRFEAWIKDAALDADTPEAQERAYSAKQLQAAHSILTAASSRLEAGARDMGNTREALSAFAQAESLVDKARAIILSAG